MSIIAFGDQMYASSLMTEFIIKSSSYGYSWKFWNSHISWFLLRMITSSSCVSRPRLWPISWAIAGWVHGPEFTIYQINKYNIFKKDNSKLEIINNIWPVLTVSATTQECGHAGLQMQCSSADCLCFWSPAHLSRILCGPRASPHLTPPNLTSLPHLTPSPYLTPSPHLTWAGSWCGPRASPPGAACPPPAGTWTPTGLHCPGWGQTPPLG